MTTHRRARVPWVLNVLFYLAVLYLVVSFLVFSVKVIVITTAKLCVEDAAYCMELAEWK